MSKLGEIEEPQSKDIFLTFPPPFLFSFSSVRDLFRVLSYKIKQNWKVNLLGGEKKKKLHDLHTIHFNTK